MIIFIFINDYFQIIHKIHFISFHKRINKIKYYNIEKIHSYFKKTKSNDFIKEI